MLKKLYFEFFLLTLSGEVDKKYVYREDKMHAHEIQ
jgi:hypothetical protein